MALKSNGPPRARLVIALISLLIVLGVELILSVRQQSQTFDEACHLFAGYRYWKNSDFGINPEHPPLVKLVAAAPLLRLPLLVPPLSTGSFMEVEFLSGRQFLYANDADSILLRSRITVSLFTFVLALLVFVAANRMFGLGPAFLALTLLVFEPNVLANGALVTTDMGLTCCLFSTVYAFYLYVRKPSVPRLLVVGLAAGLTLAAKHSGILIFPILVLLALSEAILASQTASEPNQASSERWNENRKKQTARLVISLAIVGCIAFAVLWSVYGLRFQARPAGLEMAPRLAEYAGPSHHPIESKMVQELARWRLLPEAYIYGFVEIAKMANSTPTFLFGRVYPRGQWFYFPAAFLIKSTLALLLLSLLLPFARAIRGREVRREVLFMAIPPAFYFLVAIGSGVNLGVRHILPVFPYLLALVGYAAWTLARQRRHWAYLIAGLLAFHIISSLRSFPNYLAYSNEIWGGPANTYKVLTDSNVDWGQGLKALRRYLDLHQIKNCSLADFVSDAADPAYYGIPCQLLPSSANELFHTPMDVVPQTITGTVFVSASEASGTLWGPGELNPYLQFQATPPKEKVAGSILVFDGRFDVPLASAITHENKADEFFQHNELELALSEARVAVALAPKSVGAQAALGNALLHLKRDDEARRAFQTALSLAQTVYPQYQKRWVERLQIILTGLSAPPGT
jgi:tetratricopeptide (TPR) repeat protein